MAQTIHIIWWTITLQLRCRLQIPKMKKQHQHRKANRLITSELRIDVCKCNRLIISTRNQLHLLRASMLFKCLINISIFYPFSAESALVPWGAIANVAARINRVFFPPHDRREVPKAYYFETRSQSVSFEYVTRIRELMILVKLLNLCSRWK